jgi:hypothetical protein
LVTTRLQRRPDRIRLRQTPPLDAPMISVDFIKLKEPRPFKAAFDDLLRDLLTQP